MPLIVIIGTYGTGKTTLSTDMALTSKIPVIANYDIGEFEILPDGTKKLIKRHENVEPLDLTKLLHLPYNECKVLLDEGYTYLESRTSTSKLNRYMSYILFQSRKKGITIIVTAQLEGSLDNRFVALADIRIYCMLGKDGFIYFITNGRTVRKMKIPFKKAENIFNKYDTSQVIMPFNMEELENEIANMDKKTLKENVDKLEKEIRKEYEDIKFTHAIVNNFLLENEYDEFFSSYLYARLQKPKPNKPLQKQT